ncbi:MAG: biotin--[acetyl-CoA-carboxylase] ligase [Lachnospiraceae bacterium]|nr:biotin--[acetyl-CoA-carboxylase] ligase [Lachnospiraceae bacterium]
MADTNWSEDLARYLYETGEDSFYTMKYFETIDSTNEGIKRAAAEGASEGLVYVGEEQTAGKGRLGRKWVSPAGEASYFSFLLRPKFSAEHVAPLTLVMGLSVAEAVQETVMLPVEIKWPNDIVIHGKKICGILTEAGLGSNGLMDYVVIGIGINVNNKSFDPSIADRATSLKLEWGGRDVSRALVTAASLKYFHRNYVKYCETEDLSGLIKDYNYLLASRDKQVRIEDPKGPYTAISRGIDKDGSLIVDLPDGTERKIATGEVSVRGIYGYV